MSKIKKHRSLNLKVKQKQPCSSTKLSKISEEVTTTDKKKKEKTIIFT